MPYLLLLLSLQLCAIDIIDKPIIFDEERVKLSKEYIASHYALKVNNIHITPRIIVVHWTALNDFNRSFKRFNKSKLSPDRTDITKASKLNISTHFMIDRDGRIYRLMNEKDMARHVIGLNYNSIGIENVGGQGDREDLTPKQLKANIGLISYLKEKYSSIEYLIGHFEYTHCENHPLWLEKDSLYRTLKYDPGKAFMQNLRKKFTDLKSCKVSLP